MDTDSIRRDDGCCLLLLTADSCLTDYLNIDRLHKANEAKQSKENVYLYSALSQRFPYVGADLCKPAIQRGISEQCENSEVQI